MLSMIKSTKIAISLPTEDLRRIEKIRKALKLQRSSLIHMAIRFWLENVEKQEMLKQYEDGYRRKPESIEEIKVLEKLSAESFKEEGLK